MVHAPVAASTSPIVQPTPATSVAVRTTSDASIAAYLAAGEQMRIVAGRLAVALLVLMAAMIIAWVTGVIPVSLGPS